VTRRIRRNERGWPFQE